MAIVSTCYSFKEFIVASILSTESKNHSFPDIQDGARNVIPFYHPIKIVTS